MDFEVAELNETTHQAVQFFSSVRFFSVYARFIGNEARQSGIRHRFCKRELFICFSRGFVLAWLTWRSYLQYNAPIACRKIETPWIVHELYRTLFVFSKLQVISSLLISLCFVKNNKKLVFWSNFDQMKFSDLHEFIWTDKKTKDNILRIRKLCWYLARRKSVRVGSVFYEWESFVRATKPEESILQMWNSCHRMLLSWLDALLVHLLLNWFACWISILRRLHQLPCMIHAFYVSLSKVICNIPQINLQQIPFLHQKILHKKTPI